jgi:hypothetical protein
MPIKKEIAQTVAHCVRNLPDLTVTTPEIFYAHLPLCVIDSVFSIGVLYEGVKNTVHRFCSYYDIPQKAPKDGVLPSKRTQLSTSDIISSIGDSTPKFLAEKVFENRQRTSVKNGILKADAVVQFLSILKDFNVEYFQDVDKVINNKSFEFCIQNIPGQTSGISLRYFFMLAGNENFIKPDRMVIRFLQEATGKLYRPTECHDFLIAVTEELNKKGYEITPRKLDSLIWNYQRAN